jgi:hypothetical protein
MRAPTRLDLAVLGIIAAVAAVWFVTGQRRLDLDAWWVRDPAVEADAGARAAVATWATGHFGPAAQLTSVTIRRSRWERLANIPTPRTYIADLRITQGDSTHCRRLDLTWRDPQHAGRLPEWTYSQRGRDVYGCDGRRIGRVSEDRVRR